ncbi:MAG: metal-dependent transcriptional regulator, partial [Actinobacteria bacterium]|nr:metal-dependent transcriptional regulator [Actinomycetota bacterium]
APSVTGMLGKMHAQGLVKYQPYKGAELTDDGRQEAVRLVRRHRLLETFMITELGFGWDEVHAEAELMEHVVSDEFTERLAAHLGQPLFDPHGDPIPQADGSMPTAPHTPLAQLQQGERFVVHRVPSQDSEVLAYLQSIGVEPGTELRLRGREPGGNLLLLERTVPGSAGGSGEPGAVRQLSLSREMAGLVLGQVLSHK